MLVIGAFVIIFSGIWRPKLIRVEPESLCVWIEVKHYRIPIKSTFNIISILKAMGVPTESVCTCDMEQLYQEVLTQMYLKD